MAKHVFDRCKVAANGVLKNINMICGVGAGVCGVG
jgi:hypothetical protein